ncbi:hypothetical protein OQA88_3781 [Cercophora sp. LCS_1]
MESPYRVEPRVGQFCQIIKVLAYGCMVESAALFPLANREALWFRFATLSVFIISSLAFTGLHFESFVSFGQYTIPVAAFVAIFTAWQAGSYQEQLIPWLPLFISISFLATVAAHHLQIRYGARHRTVDVESQASAIPVESLQERSASRLSLSDANPSRPPSGLGSVDSRFFADFAPTLEYTPQSGDSVISLSGVPPRARSNWGSMIRGFFPGQNDRQGPHAPDQFQAIVARGNPVSGPDMDLESEGETAASNQPLLRSQSL